MNGQPHIGNEDTAPPDAVIAIELWEIAPGRFRRRMRIAGRQGQRLRTHVKQLQDVITDFFNRTIVAGPDGVQIAEIEIDPPEEPGGEEKTE